MANIKPLQGPMTLREMYPVVNENITKLNEDTQAVKADVGAHKASDKAHGADAITYKGGVVGAATVKQAIDDVKGELNTIVASAGDGTKDTEIVLARADKATLGDRLDGVDEQLADTERQVIEMNNIKADKAELNITNTIVSQKADSDYVDAVTQSLASGSPKGTYATVSALQSAHPAGNNNTYVVSADGKWYYWNSTTWIAGGQYQSTGIADRTLTPVKLNLKFTYYPVTSYFGRRTVDASGNFVPSTSRYTSDFIALRDEYTVINADATYKIALRLFDISKTVLLTTSFSSSRIDLKGLKSQYPDATEFLIYVANVANDTIIADGLGDYLSSAVYIETSKYPASKTKIKESELAMWSNRFPDANFNTSALTVDDNGYLKLGENISSSQFHRWSLYQKTQINQSIHSIRSKFLVGQSSDESNRVFLESSDGRVVYVSVTRTGGVGGSIEAFELNKVTGSVALLGGISTSVPIVYPTTAQFMDIELRVVGKSLIVYVNGVYHAGYSLFNRLGTNINKCGVAYRGTTVTNSTLVDFDIQYQPHKIMHISIDDTFELLKGLTTDEASYTSLFDHPTFAQLRNLHNEYGAVFSFYLFWTKTTESFTIADVTIKFKTEFLTNAHWLKFGYHSMYEDTFSNSLSDADLLANVTAMHNAISNFASPDNIDKIVRFGFFSVSQSGLKTLKNNNLILGALTADDNRADNCDLSGGPLEIIRLYDRFTDVANGLNYFRTEYRFDSATSTTIVSQLNTLHNNQNNNNQYIMFGHSMLIEPIEVALKWARNKGDIRFDYPQNII